MSIPEREVEKPVKWKKAWTPSSKHEMFQKLAFVFTFAFAWACE